MLERFSVYLAGPISGESYDGCVTWREEIIKLLPPKIVGYSPMRAKEYLNSEDTIDHSYEDKMFSSQRGLFTRDMNDCRICDGLIVNLLGAKKVSIGTVMEITTFWWQRKPIVLVMEEDNIHNHPMIREACPFVVHNIREAVSSMTTILLPVGH